MGDVRSLVRVGVVSDLDKPHGKIRVYYPDMNSMVSDWLYVMRYPNMKVRVTNGTSQGHTHTATAEIEDWFPKVDDKVLVLQAYGFNSDGYVLGVIQ